VIEKLQQRCPFLQTTVIGRSVLGRPIVQISIGREACRVGFARDAEDMVRFEKTHAPLS